MGWVWGLGELDRGENGVDASSRGSSEAVEAVFSAMSGAVPTVAAAVLNPKSLKAEVTQRHVVSGSGGAGKSSAGAESVAGGAEPVTACRGVEYALESVSARDG